MIGAAESPATPAQHATLVAGLACGWLNDVGLAGTSGGCVVDFYGGGLDFAVQNLAGVGNTCMVNMSLGLSETINRCGSHGVSEEDYQKARETASDYKVGNPGRRTDAPREALCVLRREWLQRVDSGPGESRHRGRAQRPSGRIRERFRGPVFVLRRGYWGGPPGARRQLRQQR